jgi:hypothetical protein
VFSGIATIGEGSFARLREPGPRLALLVLLLALGFLLFFFFLESFDCFAEVAVETFLVFFELASNLARSSSKEVAWNVPIGGSDEAMA